MTKGMVLAGLLAGCAGGYAGAQQGSARESKKSCAVTRNPNPSEAEQALDKGRYGDAERMFAAMPGSDEVTAGLVRAELGQGKVNEALAHLEKETEAHPNDAVLMDVLGEVRYRRGEVEDAAKAYNRSLALNPCSGRTRYDIGRYMNLNGLYGSAQAQLELAHKLSPDDPIILRAWESTQRVPLTAEQQMERLRQREASASDEQKAPLENTIKGIEARQKGDCTLVQPVSSAKIPLLESRGDRQPESPPHGMAVEVMLNGKRRHFLLDTGASGVLIQRNAAKALGLTVEAETKSYGIGDEGMQETAVTHVDDLKLGPLEFHNCMVRVLETNSHVGEEDGLFGPDVLRDYVVTLDFPAQEMRLSPLPRSPDETSAPVSLDAAPGDPGGRPAAETRKDRYVAPEMKNWTRVFRSGHDLIFPTSIGNAPRKLFIMDTGASLNLISPEAAREVSRVSRDSDEHIRGLSGEVKNVMGTGAIDIVFGGIKQESMGMTSFDMDGVSRSAGVAISGFIGFQTLRQLVIEIDYRDNLVHLTYRPHLDIAGR